MSKSVVLELEWVLRGYYKSPIDDVLTVMRHLQTFPNVEIEDRLGVDWAINALADGFYFADALHHASYRQCSQVATLDDRKFPDGRLTGLEITRQGAGLVTGLTNFAADWTCALTIR